MNKVFFILSFVSGVGVAAFSPTTPTPPSAPSRLQVVSDKPNPRCEVLPLKRPIPLYQDPAMFLSDLSMLMYLDPKVSIDEMFENKPMRRQLRENEPIMRLGEVQLHNDLFRVLSESSKLWLREARAKGPVNLIKIKTCGEPGDPFADELGFLREDEVAEASKVVKETSPQGGGMPPSIAPNDIPVYTRTN